MSDYLVQFNNISKFFGKVIALKDVTMKVKKGEIMCLLGRQCVFRKENGTSGERMCVSQRDILSVSGS